MKECFLSDAIELCCCSVYGIFAKTIQGQDNYPEVMVLIIEYCPYHCFCVIVFILLFNIRLTVQNLEVCVASTPFVDILACFSSAKGSRSAYFGHTWFDKV